MEVLTQGYRERMKLAGLGESEFDVDNFNDKYFVTYRKTKNFNKDFFFRYHGWNWINKHHTRNTGAIWKEFEEQDLPKRIYQARPSLVLMLDNENMSMKMGEKLNGK